MSNVNWSSSDFRKSSSFPTTNTLDISNTSLAKTKISWLEIIKISPQPKINSRKICQNLYPKFCLRQVIFKFWGLQLRGVREKALRNENAFFLMVGWICNHKLLKHLKGFIFLQSEKKNSESCQKNLWLKALKSTFRGNHV